MDHKDLLDSVIANMTETTEKAIPDDESVDNRDNCIRLELSTGETRVIYPEDFDWATAIQHIPEMLENETSFRNMMFGLIHTAGDDSEDTKKFIDNIINQLTEYLKGYNININYRDYNPNISDRDIAMAMLFDTNNIARTMSFHTSLYSMMTMLTSPMMTGVDLAGEDTDSNEMKIYRVIFTEDTDGVVNIVSCNETNDYSPDIVGVVEEVDDKNYSVIVTAYSEEMAKYQALSIAGINRSIDIDDHDTSGLISE